LEGKNLSTAKKIDWARTGLDRAEVLQSSFLFRNVPIEVLQQIEKHLDSILYAQGEPIFVENEKSDRVYFIAQGSVEIVKYRPQAGSMQRIVTFEAGECFSELSLITQSQHSTSAIAMTDTEVLQLQRDTFLSLMLHFPQIGRNLIQNLATLNHQVLHERTQIDTYREGLQQLSSQLTRLLPFSFIEQYQVLPVRYHQGYLLVALRDPNNPSFYKAFRVLHPDLRIKVCLITEKDFQLLRKAVVPLYNGHHFTLQTPPRKVPTLELEPLEVMRTMEPFAQYSPEGLSELLQLCEQRLLKTGEYLYQSGQASESIYLLLTGDLELRMTQAGGGSRFVSHAAAGEILGEVSFLTGTPHSLSARAGLDSQVLVIPQDVFSRLSADPRFILDLAQRMAKRLQRSNHMARLQDAAPSIQVNKIAQLASLLPYHLLQQHFIIPLELQGQTLMIGVLNTDSDHIYSILHRYIGHLRVELVMITEAAYKEGLRILLNSPQSNDFGTVSLVSLQRKSHDIVSDIDHLLTTAVRMRASDVHLEIQSDGLTFRFRIDGILQELVEKVSLESGRQMLNRLKIMAQLDIGESRLPQDGHISLQHLQQNDCPTARLSLVPTVFGEKAVLRLHKAHIALLPLELLTADRVTVLKLREVVEAREGVCLVAGPTGSGKTSTLYAMLKALNKVDRHVVSVEDPVEAVIPGVTQIPVNRDIGRTFDVVLRHILRQDPDIIMVGEIRDSVSAQMTFEAAITGHLVLTTVHAIDTLSAIPRLMDLGVSRATLSSGLNAVISQRLLRAICPECRTERSISSKEREIFTRYLPSLPSPEKLSIGQGCAHCRYTGYFDRLAVFELWQKSGELQAYWTENPSIPHLYRKLQEKGFQPLMESGLRFAAQGLTTVEEVLRHCPKPPL